MIVALRGQPIANELNPRLQAPHVRIHNYTTFRFSRRSSVVGRQTPLDHQHQLALWLRVIGTQTRNFNGSRRAARRRRSHDSRTTAGNNENAARDRRSMAVSSPSSYNSTINRWATVLCYGTTVLSAYRCLLSEAILSTTGVQGM
jgi:hypothetical protein